MLQLLELALNVITNSLNPSGALFKVVIFDHVTRQAVATLPVTSDLTLPILGDVRLAVERAHSTYVLKETWNATDYSFADATSCFDWQPRLHQVTCRHQAGCVSEALTIEYHASVRNTRSADLMQSFHGSETYSCTLPAALPRLPLQFSNLADSVDACVTDAQSVLVCQLRELGVDVIYVGTAGRGSVAFSGGSSLFQYATQQMNWYRPLGSFKLHYDDGESDQPQPFALQRTVDSPASLITLFSEPTMAANPLVEDILKAQLNLQWLPQRADEVPTILTPYFRSVADVVAMAQCVVSSSLNLIAGLPLPDVAILQADLCTSPDCYALVAECSNWLDMHPISFLDDLHADLKHFNRA